MKASRSTKGPRKQWFPTCRILRALSRRPCLTLSLRADELPSGGSSPSSAAVLIDLLLMLRIPYRTYVMNIHSARKRYSEQCTNHLYCTQIEQSAVASLMAQETATRVRSTSDQGRRASDQGAGRPAGSAPIHQLRVCGAELGCRPKRAEAVRLLSGSKPVCRSPSADSSGTVGLIERESGSGRTPFAKKPSWLGPCKPHFVHICKFQVGLPEFLYCPVHATSQTV